MRSVKRLAIRPFPLVCQKETPVLSAQTNPHLRSQNGAQDLFEYFTVIESRQAQKDPKLLGQYYLVNKPNPGGLAHISTNQVTELPPWVTLCQANARGEICDTLEPLNVERFYMQKLSKNAFSQANTALLKAVKIRDKPISQTTVLDVTAGMGKDSLILRHSGAMRVHMVERNPVLCLMLSQSLNLASMGGHPRVENLVNGMSVEQGDSIDVMQTMAGMRHSWDVVYVDPMYPIELARKRVREGYTKSRHDISFLRKFLAYYALEYDIELKHNESGSSYSSGGDSAWDNAQYGFNTDGELKEIIQSAVQVARRKVIVKRPSYAPKELHGFSVKHSFSMKDTRYDLILGRATTSP